MILDDLGAAIEEHSHDEDLTNEIFWENLYDKHWADYAAETAHPSLKDFEIWAEEKDLIPAEVDYE